MRAGWLATILIFLGCGGSDKSTTPQGVSTGGVSGSGGASTAMGGGTPAGGSHASTGGASAAMGGGTPAGGSHASTGGASGTGGKSETAASFELEGKWLFLGPSPSEGQFNFKINGDSMVYTDENGAWSSEWTIKAYDNELHQFQVAFKSGTGNYLPTGQNMSGTYVLSAPMLTLQLSEGFGSYPTIASPSCTDGDGNPISNCRLYMKE